MIIEYLLERKMIIMELGRYKT